MDGLFTTIANYFIGTFESLPHADIQVDWSILTDFAPTLNYFLPLYLIAPLLGIWFGSVGIILAVMAVWGFIKRKF